MEQFKGSLWKRPPPRDTSGKGADTWMALRRNVEGAEGLWRIHDKLYDFSKFIAGHPGGEEWLRVTQGTDITEAFETHHISPMPSRMLKRFEVREAKTERLPPYTFKPGGFYATLRGRVYGVLPEPEMRGISVQTRLLADVVAFFLFTFAILTASYQSFYLALVGGTLLAMLTVASHNFFHLRDNWRRYYFDLSTMASSDWMISHAMSHHLYPNSLYDLEVSMFEPAFVRWLPEKKSLFVKIFPWIGSAFLYVVLFPSEPLRRALLKGFRKTDLIPLIIPLVMLRYAPEGHIISTLLLWVTIVLSGSFVFAVVGINAAHHHPEIFHDGDTPREDTDWGLAALDTVRDRPGISGVSGHLKSDSDGALKVVIDSTKSEDIASFVKVMFNFGHHSLHHLFPTIDHWHLPKLYPVLEQTLNEFGIPFTTKSIASLVIGQFQQASRSTPNPLPPKSIKIAPSKN
ncbi:cytochrome b5-related protein-like [Neocloeon triangulifer]|uniref:cytochrome b5-related protein-like n=1 Tax=Neocloeon triangulifer TaxID=2078957 RepID=UPI00286F11B5|nr:cytochrome b5-related protein-like [Neocloeon triangulifer]